MTLIIFQDRIENCNESRKDRYSDIIADIFEMFEDLHGECFPTNDDGSTTDGSTGDDAGDNIVDCDADPTHDDCIESSGYACEVTNTCDINTIYQMIPEFNLLADQNYSPAVAGNIKARFHRYHK